jgi:type VI secretion system protein
MARGFLSRLGTGERKPDEVRSIIDHLRVLLNTRVGDAVTVPEYGLSDFSEIVHNFPEAIGHIQQSIRKTVLEYEPRLQNVSVRFIETDNPLELQFEIVARLADNKRSIVRLKTQVESSGRFSVD